jgi:hypothetical protein
LPHLGRLVVRKAKVSRRHPVRSFLRWPSPAAQVSECVRAAPHTLTLGGMKIPDRPSREASPTWFLWTVAVVLGVYVLFRLLLLGLVCSPPPYAESL